MVTEHLKRAWESYRRNLWTLVGASILVTVITGVVVFLGISVALAPFIMAAITEETVTTEAVMANMPMMMVGAIIFLIGVLLGTVLQGGFIVMARDALKGKCKIKTIFDNAKLYYKPLIGTAILKAIIVGLILSPAIIAGIVAIATKSLPVAGIAAIFGIAGIFASILFNFNNYAVVLDKTGAMGGIRKSYRIVKANYLKVLALMIIIMFIASISVALNFVIPLLGTLVAVAFISPFILLTWTSYYTSKKK